MPLNPVLYRQLWDQVTSPPTTSGNALRTQLSASLRQYAVVVAGVGLTLVMIFLATWPQDWAIEPLLLPGYERSFGFRGDRVAFGDSGGTVYVIVEVVPNGRLARAGVRPGDVPVGNYGGLLPFYMALEQADAGDEAHFNVCDKEAWPRPRDYRRIVLKATKKAQ